MCTDKVIGISLKGSTIRITQSWFEGNNLVHGGVIYDEFGSDITITNTTFVNNSASDLHAACNYCDSACNLSSSIVYANSLGTTVEIYEGKFVENVGVLIIGDKCNMLISHTKFINNKYSGHFAIVYATDTNLVISQSTFTNNTGRILDGRYTDMRISYSEFVSNINRFITIYAYGGTITTIDHTKFINNTGTSFLWLNRTNMISITHSEFVNSIVTDSLVYLDGVLITVSLSQFINNNVGSAAVLYIPHYITTENLANNVFIDNSALYEVYVDSICRPDLSVSLGVSRCISCSDHWHQNLIAIVITAFLAGIALVIFMLALNITVAVGTLNGILFYAHVVAANADTYFWSFTTPDLVTVFISWLNLDIGFDACFFVENEGSTIFASRVYKALIQLTFPAYINFLVVIVIVTSECSSKFAKIISKGNPVAVLATMILLSYAKYFNAILTSLSLLYEQPAYGSRNLDVTKENNVLRDVVEQANNVKFTVLAYFSLIIAVLILLLCVFYTALVFSWQWLLRYQDKLILKWVRYQKLRHFLEPYHAPYTPKYRYWTGLLLFVRAFLYLISLLNFSVNPRVELMSTIFVVSGLILLKGVTAKRVYMNWLLDVMETAIYFNLVAFSALTWYNLDFGGNQVAVAYTSVMIIFILLLGVIVFHVLRYTRLYTCSFVENIFKWMSSKLMEKKPIQEPRNDAPEELDGYQLERTATGDQELPTVTYSVIEIRQPTQNQ